MTKLPALAEGETIYAVVHSTDFSATAYGAPGPINGYEVVGLLAALDLDDVFRASNHIDRPWTANPEVRWQVETGAPGSMQGPRSTSVGDIIVAITIRDGRAIASAHLVANFGFQKLGSRLGRAWCRRAAVVAYTVGLLLPRTYLEIDREV